jgi:hypothetical protein
MGKNGKSRPKEAKRSELAVFSQRFKSLGLSELILGPPGAKRARGRDGGQGSKFWLARAFSQIFSAQNLSPRPWDAPVASPGSFQYCEGGPPRIALSARGGPPSSFFRRLGAPSGFSSARWLLFAGAVILKGPPHFGGLGSLSGRRRSPLGRPGESPSRSPARGRPGAAAIAKALPETADFRLASVKTGSQAAAVSDLAACLARSRVAARPF